jgi:hypothetical protein
MLTTIHLVAMFTATHLVAMLPTTHLVDVTSNTFSGDVYNNTFTYTGQLIYVTIVDDLQSKTIDDATYPFLFNTDYKKEILKGSNGNNYIRIF